MKKIITFFFAMLFSTVAMAVDTDATMTVLKDRKPMFESTTKFLGMTDAQAAALQKSGMATLDFASKHQDKGGPYTIVWKWGDQPAIDTPGMRLQAVNQVMRKGLSWLDVEIQKSEKRQKQGKDRPWGE